MESGNQQKNREGEEGLSPYWKGRLKQEERDGKSKKAINAKRVLTAELLLGLLDMPPTASSRRIVESILHRLGKGKYVKKIREAYVTYYVSPLVEKRGDPQYAHKLMESTALIALERALVLEEVRMSDQLRKEGGNPIPDLFVKVGSTGFPVEIDTGEDDLDTLRDKGERYHRNRDYLLTTFDVERLRVLFITKRPGRVPHIVERLHGIGSGGMFLVTCQDQFKPFDNSILSPIWHSPKDPELHTLLEE